MNCLSEPSRKAKRVISFGERCFALWVIVALTMLYAYVIARFVYSGDIVYLKTIAVAIGVVKTVRIFRISDQDELIGYVTEYAIAGIVIMMALAAVKSFLVVWSAL